MIKKHGLGKGLSALIPENDIDNENMTSSIDINLIKANVQQPRKYFDEDKICLLANSIKEYGIIEPLVLKKDGDIYIIIAGERRFRAAKMAGLTEVPAVITDLNNKNILELSLIENIQREDLNPIEEAVAYKKLLEDFNFTQDDLSIKIGKSRSAISNCMRLLNLDQRVQDYIIEGIISEGHGRALAGLNDKDGQYEISQMIIDNELSVRETERIISNYGKENIIKPKNTMDVYHKDIQSKLENYFGSKVTLQCKKDKGTIKIEFTSDDELQRIVEILKI